MKGITMILTKEAMEFLDEAKTAFQNHEEYSTYTNREETYIAFRETGIEIRDSITVYKVDHKVATFESILKPGMPLVLEDETTKNNSVDLLDLVLKYKKIIEFYESETGIPQSELVVEK